MKNLFSRKKTVSQKISSAVNIGKRNKQDKYIKTIQQIFLYLAIFMAGYILGMVQNYL
ncbi:MAG: hypothetical protein ABFQ62_00705 [Patescibacteria group bacterium]